METPTYITNHKAVVDFYGHWPLFHDAEVIAYVPSTQESDSLALTIHAWQMTDKVDPKGYFVLEKHALVSFRFDSVFDNEMAAFDRDNILFGIEFSKNSDGSSF